MVEATDSIAIALREVTKRSGRLLWGDPVRLRSRLQYALGSVSDQEGAVLDAVVLAAIHEVPQALVHRSDLSVPTRDLSDEVGPVLSARAVALWARAVADMSSQEQAEAAAREVLEPAVVPERVDPVVASSPEPDRRRLLPIAIGLIGLLLISGVALFVLSRDSGTDVGGVSETRPTATSTSLLPVPSASAPTAPAGTAPVATTAPVAPTTPPGTAPTVTTTPPATSGRYVLGARTRLLDTRGSAPRASATVSAAGLPGLPDPAGVTAVILHVTVDAPSGAGSLRAVAAGAPAGQAAHLSFGAVPRSSGLVFAPLAADGRIDLRLGGTTANLVVDAVGFVATSARAGGTSLVGMPSPVALKPISVPANGTVEVELPAGTSAALLSVVAQASAPGAVTFFTGSRPDTPSLVIDRGGATSTVVLAPATSGRVSVHSTVAVELAAFEVARFVAAPAPPQGALSLLSADPVRATSGTCSDRSGKAISRIATVFPTARAFVLSISVERAPADGSLFAYTIPAPVPGMADVSFAAGETRSAPVFVMVSGDRINLLCSGGLPDFVADIVAVFE